MKCKGWQQLQANAKKGISMALVLCVSAFFIAFAAAILYTAGMLTAQSNQRLKEERCYQLAKSYSDVLKSELTKYDNKYTDDGSVTGDGSFYAFANKFLDDEKYLEYNSDYEDSTKYHFVVDGSNVSDLSQSPMPEKGYGNLTVTLKKEQNADENMKKIMDGGQVPVVSDGNYTSTIDAIENTTLRQYIFTVEVTAYYEDASYTYSTEYTRAEKYRVTFQQNNNTIVWVKNATDGGSWKLGNTAGEDYQIDGNTPIVYSYLKSSPTSCKFEENTYQDSQEGGGTDAAN
mgnify:CR=1 FL=1